MYFLKGCTGLETPCTARGRAALSALQAVSEPEGPQFGVCCFVLQQCPPQEQILQKGIGGLCCAACQGEVPVAGCFSYLSSCFSSACRVSKQRILLLQQTCLEPAKKCPAPLVKKKYKKPILFYSKCNSASFSNGSVKVSKL